MFKREWFNFSVVPPDQVPAGLEWVRYYDLAASIKKTGHFTATAACALDTNGDLYIRDVWRVREEWPDIRRRMIETMRAEPGVVHGVELKAYGLAAVQDLMREPKIAHIALVGVDIAPGQSKIVRAMAWSPRAEAGKVKLVRGPWITSFLNEICAFPHGSHDDQADMVSGCVQMIGSGIGMAVSHGPTLDQLFSRGMS